MAVELTRFEHSSAALRKLARSCTCGYQALRICAIADIMDGFNRAQAAMRNGMTRQTLRDWVHRYNAGGIFGLQDRSGRGPRFKIASTIQEQLREKLINGPDPAKDGVIRWRMVDLQAWLATEHDIHCCKESVRRMVHKLGFRKMTARPRHHKQDSATIEAFKKTL